MTSGQLPAATAGVQGPQAEHDAPQAKGDATFPGERGQADRGEHQQQRGHGAEHSRAPAPRPTDGVHRKDDADVLQQPERTLAFQGVAEQPVPASQHVQRERPVQVQEVDVGNVALQNALREGEHEALFHRAAGGEEEAPQRQCDDRQHHPQ